MMRNVLRTDASEAGELVSWRLATHLLVYAGLPALLLWRIRIVDRAVASRGGVQGRRARARGGRLLRGAASGLQAVRVADAQPQGSPLPRSARELPLVDLRGRAEPDTRCGEGAPADRPRRRARPLVGSAHRPARSSCSVVGETARAANWESERLPAADDARALALPVINFADVTSCGTNTEVSLPCMFAPVGRRDYDEARIRGSESLLHVLARAGVDVTGATTSRAARARARACRTTTSRRSTRPACAATGAASTKACSSA
jgi:lipid A ethanolaminephosphotransferase